jgi:hypothetical protein
VTITRGLNSPQDVYFFSRKPGEYALPSGYYYYEIDKATENSMESAKANVRRSTRFETIKFNDPKVDVQGSQYIYVVRSTATRDKFKEVMSPEYLYVAKGVGIQGQHYSASETYGDAIGITFEAGTPQAAKEQFQAWYAKIKEALNALDERFAFLNKQMDQMIEELVAKRLEELKRAKDAL